MAEQAAGYRHVLVVPSMAEGHVNGMLRFAFLLAATHHQQGLLVSFGYPARTHALALKRNRLSVLPPSLRVHVIQDGLPSAEHESPTGAHFMGSIQLILNGVEDILQQYSVPVSRDLGDEDAVDGRHEKGSSDMHSSTWPPICCIISDTFLPGTQELADRFGIPRVDFWTGNATVYYMVAHLQEITDRGLLPLPEGTRKAWKVDAPLIDFIPGLPSCHLAELPRELLEASDVSVPRFQFMIEAFAGGRKANRILVHSLYELESHVYESMRAQGFPIYPVGPLLYEAGSDSTVDLSECVQWLDQQKPASVVYVAFGTHAKLNIQEMHSLALGLEASGYYFLWVIRTNALPSLNLRESLPQDFMERTVSQGKGMIVTWAPQMQVLKHTAMGAFLTHCGWNSILESLWEGVPMVACPRAAEQRCNARHIVHDWKVGVEIERQDDDGSFTTEAVQKAIKGVMGNQEVKERALHFKQVARETIAHGPSHSNIVSFVDHLLHLPVPSSRPY